MHVELGRATAVALPLEELGRRQRATSYAGPIFSAVLHDVARDQMMARHRANHVQVPNAPTADLADRAPAAKAATFDALSFQVDLCGDELRRASTGSSAGRSG